MATTLDEFLALPDVENEEYTVKIDRLGELVVKPMTYDQFTNYQNRARLKSKLNIDTGKLNLLILAGQIVSPNFSNAEFLAKANCQTAQDFIKKKFKAGEITEIASQIIKYSGFDVDFEDKVEEAKN